MARYVDRLVDLERSQLHDDGPAFGVAAAKAPRTGRGGPEPLADLPLRVRPTTVDVLQQRRPKSARRLRHGHLAILNNCETTKLTLSVVESRRRPRRRSGAARDRAGRCLPPASASCCCWRWASARPSLVAQDDDETVGQPRIPDQGGLSVPVRPVCRVARQGVRRSPTPVCDWGAGRRSVIADLEQIAEIKKIQDRPIQIRRFSSAADVRACHILFLPASLAAGDPGRDCSQNGRPWRAACGGGGDFLDWGESSNLSLKRTKSALPSPEKPPTARA